MDPNKKPPEVKPPSEGIWNLLNQFLGGIGGGGFDAATEQAYGALGEQGGFDTVKGMLPNLAKWALGGSDKLADAYKKKGMQDTYKAGMAGLKALKADEGARGQFGSTVAGTGRNELLSAALDQMNNINLGSEQIREQTKQSRLGLGMQGLGALGGLASDQRGQNISGMINLAGLLGNQANINQQQLLQGAGFQNTLEQQPWGQQMDIWSTLMNKPKQPSGIDMLLGGLGALLPFS